MTTTIAATAANLTEDIDLDEFIFTSWLFHEPSFEFYKQHIEDLEVHDKCNRCGVWVISQLIASKPTPCGCIYTYKCPNCEAIDNYY